LTTHICVFYGAFNLTYKDVQPLFSTRIAYRQ